MLYTAAVKIRDTLSELAGESFLNLQFIFYFHSPKMCDEFCMTTRFRSASHRAWPVRTRHCVTWCRSWLLSACLHQLNRLCATGQWHRCKSKVLSLL